MAEKKKRLISPLLMRILIINLISLLILSAFNYFTFYNNGNKAFIQSLTHYNQRVAEIAFNNINKQIIQNTVEIHYRFFSDIPSNKSLLQAQQKDISNSPESVLSLHSKLNEILALYPMVHSINIYYEATNTIVTGRGNVHFVQNDDERNKFLPWYKSYAQSGKSFQLAYLKEQVYPIQKHKVADLAQGNDEFISAISTIKNSKWGDKKIVVAVNVLPKYFSDFIDEDQGQFIISDKDMNIIYSTHGKEIQAQEIMKKAALMQTNTVKFDELQLVISHSSNDTLGLKYYHAIPYSTFFKDYNIYLNDLVIIYILSIAVMFAILTLVFYYTNKTYSKRLLLSTKKAGIQLAENQSFDGSLDNLATQLTNINTEMQISRPILYNNQVRSLLFGRQASAAYSELSPILGNFEGVLCIIVNIQTNDSSKLDIVAVQTRLQANETACRVLLTTLEQNQICIAICTNANDANKICESIFALISTMYSEHFTADGEFVFFGEKREYSFKQAFESAQNICRYHFIFPQKQRLRYKDIGTIQLKNTGSHLKIFAEIEKDINAEKYLAYKEHVYDLTESFKYGNYSIDYCSSTLRDFVTLFYNITLHRQLDMLLIFGYDIRAHYKQIDDINAFYLWGCEMGEVLMQNLRQRKKALAPDLQSRIILLIDNNIENNISLDFLADKLGQRADVLSRTFKQLMGVSYVDYVRDKKLTLAKQFIAKGMSMKEIAARLGYSSAQYFIKIFKERYGVTPYQYKKNNLSTNETQD